MSDWFALAIVVAVITVLMLGLALLLHDPSAAETRPERDPVLRTDVHTDARRLELATLQRKAAKGWEGHHADRVAGVIVPKTKPPERMH